MVPHGLNAGRLFVLCEEKRNPGTDVTRQRTAVRRKIRLLSKSIHAVYTAYPSTSFPPHACYALIHGWDAFGNGLPMAGTFPTGDLLDLC